MHFIFDLSKNIFLTDTPSVKIADGLKSQILPLKTKICLFTLYRRDLSRIPIHHVSVSYPSHCISFPHTTPRSAGYAQCTGFPHTTLRWCGVIEGFAPSGRLKVLF